MSVRVWERDLRERNRERERERESKRESKDKRKTSVVSGGVGKVE